MKTKSSLTVLALLFSLAVPATVLTGCAGKEGPELENGADEGRAELSDDLQDAGITAKVRTSLATDERVRDFGFEGVEVETRSGVVILKGSVGEEGARTAAEDLARVTEGVSRVVNRITVGSGEGSAT